MNVQIRDPALFRHLSHLDVRAYLAGQQWTDAGRIGNKATVHTQQDATHRTCSLANNNPHIAIPAMFQAPHIEYREA